MYGLKILNKYKYIGYKNETVVMKHNYTCRQLSKNTVYLRVHLHWRGGAKVMSAALSDNLLYQ